MDAEALRLFTHLKRAKTKCFTSPIVVANVYYILSRHWKNQIRISRIVFNTRAPKGMEWQQS